MVTIKTKKIVFLVIMGLLLLPLVVMKTIDALTPIQVKRMAKRVSVSARDLEPQIVKIDELIAEHGIPDSFPSIRARTKAQTDLIKGISAMYGIQKDDAWSVEYNEFLEQLNLDENAYLQFLADNSRTVYNYDSISVLMYFCNDEEHPIKSYSLDRVFDRSHPFSYIRELCDKETVINRVKRNNNTYSVDAKDFLKSKLKELDYVKKLKYIVFVNYTRAILPNSYHSYSAAPGAVSARADIYQIDDKSFVDSIKVFAVSSPSITQRTSILQSSLDNDIRNNLEREIIRVLAY